MRVLLDENPPHDLAGALTGHAVSTVQSLGWAGTKNGALLRRAADVCDVFISMDGNIEHQQNLTRLSFAVVVVDVPSNRMEDLVPVVPDLLRAIAASRPGEVRHVGKPSKRRGADQVP